MDFVNDIKKGIEYIEMNLENDITIEDIALNSSMSICYFQKAFSILLNMSVSEYIRNRRLSLASLELKNTENKIIDIALKYGYDSQESFTKAFTRFHNATPKEIRKGDKIPKIFMPLKMKFVLEGGYDMDVKILKKAEFTVVGKSKIIKGSEGYKECPKFWDEFYKEGNAKYVSGMYGICIDDDNMNGTFKYVIADDYIPSKEYPDSFETINIKESLWAVFPCIGPMPFSLQSVNTKIFSEWIPNNKEYEVSSKYCVEYYTDPRKYDKGMQDEKYYSEIWIPIKKK